MTTTTLTTDNEGYGFYGTIRTYADQDKAWAAALIAIAAETDCSHEATRLFLDSTHGRHFADSVVGNLQQNRSLEASIAEAVAEHMAWRIGRRMSRSTGIPQGLPYLTGLVAHFEIQLEG